MVSRILASSTNPFSAEGRKDNMYTSLMVKHPPQKERCMITTSCAEISIYERERWAAKVIGKDSSMKNRRHLSSSRRPSIMKANERISSKLPTEAPCQAHSRASKTPGVMLTKTSTLISLELQSQGFPCQLIKNTNRHTCTCCGPPI